MAVTTLTATETRAKQQCCERMVGSRLLPEQNRLREKDAAVNWDARIAWTGA